MNLDTRQIGGVIRHRADGGGDGDPSYGPYPATSPIPALGGLAGAFAYDAGDMYGQETAEWQPWLRSPDSEVNYERDRIVARTRDLERNDPTASGAIERIADSAIGSQFRLVAKPDYRWLKHNLGGAFDLQWAQEFRRAVEAEWRNWTEDPARFCDAQRKRTMVGMFYAALRHQLVDGDALAMLLWDPDTVDQGAARYATQLQLIDPDRLSNPYQQMDTMLLRGGVELNQKGAAVAYHIRRAHPGDWYGAAESMIWDRFPRETVWGRPIVLHAFEAKRSSGNRGVGVLSTVVTRLKMLTRYGQAELQQALLQTVFGTFIESPYDEEDVANAIGDDAAELSAYQQMREGWHQQNAVRIGGAKVPVLPPGEKINTVMSTRPNSGYAEFVRSFLRNTASATGQSAEQVSWDYSQVNYSSARSAMLEAWKTLTRRRDAFAIAFPDQVYAGWLEEAMEVAKLPMPSGGRQFWEMRAALARAKWIGPARGWVDPVAERQGAVLGLDAGFDTLEELCAEQGSDLEENLDQRQVERRMFEERGLPFPEWAQGAPVSKTDKKPDPQ